MSPYIESICSRLDHTWPTLGSNRTSSPAGSAALACARYSTWSSRPVRSFVRWPRFRRAIQTHPSQSDAAPTLRHKQIAKNIHFFSGAHSVAMVDLLHFCPVIAGIEPPYHWSYTRAHGPDAECPTGTGTLAPPRISCPASTGRTAHSSLCHANGFRFDASAARPAACPANANKYLFSFYSQNLVVTLDKRWWLAGEIENY